MQYMLTPYAEPLEPYAWWEGAFTDNELDWIQNRAANADVRASVGDGRSTEEDLKKMRRSKISWMDNTNETQWIYSKLADVASKLNSQFFKFDLTGFGEPLQLTNYDQSEHGMYQWHQDYNARISRKLSLVLQLSDPKDYEGGNLQVLIESEPITVRKQRGLIAAFPSYTLHQVTPVTSGSRQSLVSWVSGPAFR